MFNILFLFSLPAHAAAPSCGTTIIEENFNTDVDLGSVDVEVPQTAGDQVTGPSSEIHDGQVEIRDNNGSFGKLGIPFDDSDPGVTGKFFLSWDWSFYDTNHATGGRQYFAGFGNSPSNGVPYLDNQMGLGFRFGGQNLGTGTSITIWAGDGGNKDGGGHKDGINSDEITTTLTRVDTNTAWSAQFAISYDPDTDTAEFFINGTSVGTKNYTGDLGGIWMKADQMTSSSDGFMVDNVKVCLESTPVYTTGTYKTTIEAGDCFTGWDRFFVNEDVPEGTTLLYTIMDSSSNVLFDAVDVNGFMDISTISTNNTNLILEVDFTLTDTNTSPGLKSWNASYYACTKPEIKFKVVVDDPAPDGQTTVDNTVQISTTSPETNTANNVDDDTINIRLTDLCITKEVDLSSALINNTLVYTLSYTNNGPNEGTNVVIRDILPDGVTVQGAISSSPDLGAPTVSGRTNTWTFDSLAVGAGGTITITVKIDNDVALEGTTLINVGSISNDRQDTNPDCDDDNASTFVGSLPNLVVTKTGPDSIKLGETNSFTITIENTGNTNAYDVSASDVFPSGLIFVGASPVTNDSPALSWTNLGDLASGASTSITVQFTVTNLSSVFKTHTNSASATPTNGETSVTDNSDEHPVYVDIEPARLSGAVRIDADGVSSNDADRGVNPIAGVTITLTGTDVFGNSVTQSTVTAADGSYSFSGLNPGTYTVSEDQPDGYGSVSAFVGTNCVPCAADAGTNGVDQITNITLAAGDASPNNDFSEYELASIGDRVWLDTYIKNGEQDATEVGLSGVTVTLYRVVNGATNELTNTVTDGNGLYLFDDLEPGTYFVGFDLPTGAEISPVDNAGDGVDSDAGANTYCTYCTIPTELSPGEHDPTWDAGIYMKALLMVLKEVNAYWNGSAVVVEWKTLSENKTAGYFLQRADGSNGFENVQDVFVHAGNDSQGATYTMIDPQGAEAGEYEYRLVEVEIDGLKRSYGPFKLTVGAQPLEYGSAQKVYREVSFRHLPYTREAHVVPQDEQDRLAAHADELAAEAELRDWLWGERLHVEVKEEGLCYINTEAIAWGLGIPDWYAAQLLLSGELALRGQRGRIPYQPEANGAGLYFYGESHYDNYETQNSYSISWGLNPAQRPLDGGAPSVIESPPYRETLSLEEDHILNLATSIIPEDDHWYWLEFNSLSYPWYQEYQSHTLSIATPGRALNSSAELQLVVKGGVDVPGVVNEHQLEVRLNGTLLGSRQVNGIDNLRATFANIAADTLNDGANQLTLTLRPANGAQYSTLWLDQLSLSYDRHPRAANDNLRLSNHNNSQLSVEGFSSPDLTALDITDPSNPRWINNLSIQPSGTRYTLSFLTPEADHQYLLSSYANARPLTNTQGRIDSDLLHPSTRADYLLIAPPALMDEAQVLADYRAGQGHQPLVINIQDIYLHFNHHRQSPHALRSFLRYALDRWTLPPAYIVLIGDGSIDYRNLQGHNDHLIPSQLQETLDGLFVSDASLIDFDDAEGSGTPDGIPDIPIGRLPAGSPGELRDLISKIIAYEQSEGGPWADSALFLADVPDPSAGNFSVGSSNLAARISSQATVDIFYSNESDYYTQQQSEVAARINEGRSLLNYLGHGTLSSAGKNLLLSTQSANSLTNSHRAPLLIAMTCSSGRFSEPGRISLAEKLLLKADGGIIAAFSPSGLTYYHNAVSLNESLLDARYKRNRKILGQLIQDGLNDYLEKQGNDQLRILRVYNLLGDPALNLK